MSKSVTYRPDPSGLDAIGLSPQMRGIMRRAADIGAAYASSLASRYSRSGHHAGGYEVRSELIPAGRRNKLRQGATITNTTSYGAVNEFGSTRRERIGRRTLRETTPIIEAVGG